MLDRVPMDNAIVGAYHTLPSYGARPIIKEFQKILEELNKPKKGGKRKGKASSSEFVANLKKKVKMAARKPRSLSPV